MPKSWNNVDDLLENECVSDDSKNALTETTTESACDSCSEYGIFSFELNDLLNINNDLCLSSNLNKYFTRKKLSGSKVEFEQLVQLLHVLVS